MVKVMAKNFVKEDEVEKVLKLAKELVAATINEEGCIKYEMYQDQKKPDILIMIEEWETMEHLKSHMASEHFKNIVPKMSSYMNREPEMNICKKVI